MNISAIKTTIQAPIKKMFPFALGAMALASCTQPIGRIKDYCEEFDKSAVEYKECIDKCEGNFSPKDQAVLDSLVYRDLLNTTKLAKDSSAIAEFNRICATNKYDSNNCSNFEENLLKEGISAKEFNYIRSKNEPVARQFEADKALFGKLFKEVEFHEIVSHGTIDTITMTKVDPSTMEIVDTIDIDISEIVDFYTEQEMMGELCYPEDTFDMFYEKLLEVMS